MYSKDEILMKNPENLSKSFEAKIKNLKKILPQHKINNFKKFPIEDFDYNCLLDKDKLDEFLKLPVS